MKLREELATMRQQSNAVDSDGTADKLDLPAKRALFHSAKFMLAVNPFDFNNISIVTSAVNSSRPQRAAAARPPHCSSSMSPARTCST